MATVFGRKQGLQFPARLAHLGAPVARSSSWHDKAGLQQLAIIESIRRFLGDDRGGERGVHVQSALDTIGRLAGFAAQWVVWQRATGVDDPCVDAASDADRELTIAAVLGRPHRYAPHVTAYIVPAPIPRIALHGTFECLWSIMGEAVTAAGGRPIAIAQVQELFVRARTAGGSGDIRAAAASGLTVDYALCHWPAVKCLLNGLDEIEGTTPVVAPMAPIYWPLALAEVARHMIESVSSLLDPAVAMRIVLEGAVPASMIDPKHVPATIDAAEQLAFRHKAAVGHA